MSEVGIIGQKYEDRRTKKVGTLLERDDKYKTLLFKSDEGKTFSISFSGFKSNWRKLVVEESVEEQLQEHEVPESVEDVIETPEEVQVEKPVVKKATYTIDEFMPMFNAFVSSFGNDSISVGYNQKKRVAYLKFNRTKVIDFYVRSRGYFWLMMPEIVYTSTKWSIALTEVVNTPKNRREISCRIGIDDMPEALRDMKEAIVQLICDSVVEEE